MREIKFRAWDKIDKKMYDNVGLSLIGVKVYKDPDHQPPEEVILDRGRGCFELMQFTGLTDRNGVDIYDGDLLRSEGKTPWSEKSHGNLVICEWDDEYAQFRIKKIDSYNDDEPFVGAWAMPVAKRFFEVIGNFYENPELITL